MVQLKRDVSIPLPCLPPHLLSHSEQESLYSSVAWATWVRVSVVKMQIPRISIMGT